MTSDQRWLASVWPFVLAQLPSVPATVVEIGCGPLGGFVPALLDDGYEAVGVDPEAPEAPSYHRIEFEQYEPPQPVDCVVASTSLHHVADLDDVLDRVAAALVANGTLVVVEWAWERFDQATARWCFDRLPATDPSTEPGWLHRHRDRWAASTQPWEAYLAAWAAAEGLHAGREIVHGLDARFDRRRYADGPYFFADLDGISEADEQDAIDAGLLRATGIRYVGRLR
jgi:SAM-dependent methyltransferase